MLRTIIRLMPKLGETSSFHSLHMSTPVPTKVAVVLSGCGVYDGTEVHEASACLVHLSRAGADVSMYAPDIDQMHVIDHTKGSETTEIRNVLVESARIARGNIKALSEMNADGYDAVVFPGGFGAAKNLCNWAVKNVDCTVNGEVENTLKQFHSQKKPIGLCCISPVLAAKCLPGVELTVGSAEEEGGRWPYAGTAAAIEQCGAKHVAKDVTEVQVDESKKVVTTPAYMCNAPVHQIFDGVGQMISKVLELAKK